MNILFTPQSYWYSHKNHLSPWDKSVLILKGLKQTQFWFDFYVTNFYVILKGVRTIHWQILHDFLIQKKYMHKNIFGQP